MKNLNLLTFLFVILLSHVSYGQFNIDFSTGVNRSNCEFENVEFVSPSARVGYFFGIAPNYQIGRRVKVLVDFQYTLKGYEVEDRNSIVPAEHKLGYLDFISEVEYSLLEYIVFGLGVNYGVNINRHVKFGEGEWMNSNGFYPIKSTDFGLTGKIKAKYKNFFGFVRYNFGLKNISDLTFTDDNGMVISEANQYNRNLQVGIGYTLNFRNGE